MRGMDVAKAGRACAADPQNTLPGSRKFSALPGPADPAATGCALISVIAPGGDQVSSEQPLPLGSQ